MQTARLLLLSLTGLIGLALSLPLQYQSLQNLFVGPNVQGLEDVGELDLNLVAEQVLGDLGYGDDEILAVPLHLTGHSVNDGSDGSGHGKVEESQEESECCLPAEFESKLSVSALVSHWGKTQFVSAAMSVAVSNSSQRVALNATLWLNAFLHHNLQLVIDVENVRIFLVNGFITQCINS